MTEVVFQQSFDHVDDLEALDKLCIRYDIVEFIGFKLIQFFDWIQCQSCGST